MTIRQPHHDRGAFSPTPTNAPTPSAIHPSISLRHLQAKYCITKCDKKDRAAFADAVRLMTKRTWAEIESSGRHGGGSERIPQLDNQLPKDAPKNAKAIALRFSGNKPMVGYRDGGVFYVVWFDRNFSLYQH